MMKLLISLLMLFSLPLAADSEWDQVENALTESTQIKVYRSPNCQCCHKWIEHLQKHNFTVVDEVTHNLEAVAPRQQVPIVMRSCHTAVINGYLIEGHVPAQDIKRLLVEKPPVTGLSVPQMPVGTPGMEMGAKKDDFTVVTFDKDNQFRIFNRYEVGPDQQYHSVSTGE
ncbi:DUF411 domain-containing protein [Methylophaga sp.]|uniref:DUF411 domain-containing protein n=1 Tax=Methylophaga sp. TaxID=2024840 RepID=UPI0025E07575|nr:DUF411 domain-containing protein [Methylophaga sp.]